jgi:tRNA nucleotidyltransferase/poly(A) polymerase
MADYIYLLQTRLTPAQQTALARVRDVARARNLTVFLVGGAVRDLTSGSPIRDLDVVVQGNATRLRKDFEKAGGVLLGESDLMQTLTFHFANGVRIEVGSALSVTFPKPGKPVVKPAPILEDLRRRDFTANAMAVSLNEGSYGLLMDPLNGVADIENRELRLISNYGFIEDPVRMVRAVRLGARLGWAMEARTQARYDTGKAEGYISAMNAASRSYETEEILHEEDPLRVLRALEAEGWMKHLFPALTASKANESELNRLRDMAGQLASSGIHADQSAAMFPLLTAKLAPKDVAALKKSFANPGFAKQIAELEAQGKAFAAQFAAKEYAAPSAAYKLLGTAAPESVLWLAHHSKSAPVQARFKAFFTDWPQSRQRIPYTLMQEMRITPDLPVYESLLEQLFFALMDGKLDTPEAARAFLEPFSPPAPPPPVALRRRVVKREAKVPKSRAKKAVAAAATPDGDAAPEEVAIAAAAVSEPAKAAPAKAKAAPAKVSAPVKTVAAKAAPQKPVAKPVTKPAAKPVVKKAAKPVAKKAAPKKAVPVKKAPAKKAAVKKVLKPVAKKAAAKKAVAKKAVAKAPAKKAVAKKAPAKKAAAKKSVAKKAVAKKPVAKKAKR